MKSSGWPTQTNVPNWNTPMNDKVVQLFPQPMPRYLRGQASCLGCRHVWQAVAPEGTTWLECPMCYAQKGHFDYPVRLKDVPHWVCNCGNDLFFVSKEGCYCPNCGVCQDFGRN